MDEKRGLKNKVEHELREAAARIQEEAAEIGVKVPSRAKMILSASHEDFIVAQHRGPIPHKIVAEKIEDMEREFDELAMTKLGAVILRRDTVQIADPEASSSQNQSDVAE